MDDLILLEPEASYSDAKIVERLLASYGVHVVLQRGDSGAASEFTGAFGEVDIFVLAKDLDRARTILREQRRQN